MAKQELLSNEVIEQAFSKSGESLAVTSVASVWAPVVENDAILAKSATELLITTIEDDFNIKIDDETKRILVKFGAAAGALALRQLFEPYQSDTIWVSYTPESGLDQRDALRRLANGTSQAL